MRKSLAADYTSLAEVRKHYYLDQYVVIAPTRSHALHHKDYVKSGPLKEPPLEKEQSLYVLNRPQGQWAVKVIPNLYPAFSLKNPDAYGVQEIILDTNPTDTPFGRLSVEQIAAVLHVYCHRLSTLRHQRGINYVSVFHNSGLEAGASVKQTHSQVVATGLIPPELKYQAEVFSRLKRRFGSSPLARAMAWEEDQLERLIFANKYLTVVAPYASQFPYEVWLVPRRQVKSLCQLKAAETRTLAQALKAVVGFLENERISYNFHLVEAVKGMDNHFLIKVAPRPNVWAGFELNTNIAINPVAPEEAAARYRNFIEAHDAL